MRPAFEQIDEAAGKARLGVAAGIHGHEVAHGAGERKALDHPYAERCPQAIANLDQDNLVTAAAFARRSTVQPILIDVQMRVGETEVACRLQPRSVRSAGEAITRAINPQRIHLFDRASGRRL